MNRLHRTRLLMLSAKLRVASEKMSEDDIDHWITVKGNSVPVGKGETDKEAGERFVQEKEGKEPKKEKSEIEQAKEEYEEKERQKIEQAYTTPELREEWNKAFPKNTLGFDSSQTEIVLDRFNMDAVTVFDLRTAWNNMPSEKRKNVKQLTITKTRLGNAAGKWAYVDQSITIDTEIMDADAAPSVLEHEVGHSNFSKWSFEKIKKWIKAIEGIESLNSYAESYKAKKAEILENVDKQRTKVQNSIAIINSGEDGDEIEIAKRRLSPFYKMWNLKDEDLSNGKIDKLLDRWWFAQEHVYENEQHSAFMEYRHHKEGHLRPSNKKAYRQMLKVYEKGGFAKMASLTARQLYRVKKLVALLGAQDEDGRWITSKGQKIFIPKGKNPGDVLKEHFEQFTVKNEIREIGGDDLEQKRVFYHKGKWYRRQEGESDEDTLNRVKQEKAKIKADVEGYVPSQGFSKVTLGMDSTVTNISAAKSVSGKFIIRFRDIWNEMPPELRKRVKNLKIMTGRQVGYAGKASLGGIITINSAVDDATLLKAILEHEVGHVNFAFWSPEKQRKWKEAIKHLPPLTRYAAEYKQTEKMIQRKVDSVQKKWLDRLESYNEKPSENALRYYGFNHLTERWDIQPEDYASGKVKELIGDYAWWVGNVYYNEQHSIFLEHLHQDKPTESLRDKKVFEEMKKIYHEGGFAKMASLTAKQLYRIKKVVHVLRAKTFKPKPGEKPDKDGMITLIKN